jgi:hypothetical protein
VVGVKGQDEGTTKGKWIWIEVRGRAGLKGLRGELEDVFAGSISQLSCEPRVRCGEGGDVDPRHNDHHSREKREGGKGSPTNARSHR